MDTKIRILAERQTNAYYDPNRANNGGGYYQKAVVFSAGDDFGTYCDTSCGDFGRRFEVAVRGLYCAVDDVDGFRAQTNFPPFSSLAVRLRAAGIPAFSREQLLPTAVDGHARCEVRHMSVGDGRVLMALFPLWDDSVNDDGNWECLGVDEDGKTYEITLEPRPRWMRTAEAARDYSDWDAQFSFISSPTHICESAIPLTEYDADYQRP